ncbi:MAG: SDR family oxidoreductase [Gaiella sp.]
MRVQELFDLRGKVAIVTGGAKGLGRQMADALAECGADLVICARNEERCVQAAAELAHLGVRTLGLGCDVRDAGSVTHAVEATVERLGRVDILVNNAGTSWGAPAVDVPLEAWQKVIDVNLTGAFLFAQAVGRVLIAQAAGGKIVNISSVVAFRGTAPEALDALPYTASKGGLTALTTDLAVKWARFGINVNAIAPGWFPTDMSGKVLERSGELLLSRVPLGRFGSTHDLKGAIAFLASPASDYVTGQTLLIDGGLSAS